MKQPKVHVLGHLKWFIVFILYKELHKMFKKTAADATDAMKSRTSHDQNSATEKREVNRK